MSATRTSSAGARVARRSAARAGAVGEAESTSSNRSVGRNRTVARERPPRHRLLLASVGVMALALLFVLFLNAALSAGAFRQHDLEIQLILVSEKEEALARKVQVDEAPLTIEKRARAMGMVPAASPVFLDLGSGKIKGEPVPAPSPTEVVSFGDDELTAPQEKLSGTLITQTPQPVSPEPVATVTVTADPAASAAAAESTPLPSPSETPTATASPSSQEGQ